MSDIQLNRHTLLWYGITQCCTGKHLVYFLICPVLLCVAAGMYMYYSLVTVPMGGTVYTLRSLLKFLHLPMKECQCLQVHRHSLQQHWFALDRLKIPD